MVTFKKWAMQMGAIGEFFLFWIAIMTGGIFLLLKVKRAFLPISIVLILFGFLFAEGYTSLGLDTGLRWQHVRTISYFIVLPVVVMNVVLKAELASDPRLLVKGIKSGFLALITIPVVAVVIYLLMNHPTGFPWIAALLCAIVLFPGAPANLKLIPGSDINSKAFHLSEIKSAVTILITIFLFDLITLSNGGVLPTAMVVSFIIGVAVGIVLGAIVGVSLKYLLRLIANQNFRIVLIILSIYAFHYVTSALLSLHGVIGIAAMGVMLRDSFASELSVHHLWKKWSKFTWIGIFVLMGVTCTIEMLTRHWLAIVFGIVAYWLVRISINWLDRRFFKIIRNLFWDTHGPVVIVLGLSIPFEFDAWFTIQSIAYGIIIFDHLIMLPLSQLVSHIKIKKSIA